MKKSTVGRPLLAAVLLAGCNGSVAPPEEPIASMDAGVRGRSAPAPVAAGTIPFMRADYAIVNTGGSVTLTRHGNPADLRSFANPALLKFLDKHVSFDSAGTPGQVYRMYRAAFKRVPDEAGLGFWMAAAEAGMPLNTIAAQFAASKEFTDLYGAGISHSAAIKLMYNNVLGRDPDQGGLDYWLGAMAAGYTLPQLLVFFADSAENQQAVAAAIANGIDYIHPQLERPAGWDFAYEDYLSANKIYGYDQAFAPLHPVRHGMQSERFELRAGDCGGGDCARADGNRERTEFGQQGVQNLEGDEYWYGWSFYVAPDYKDSGNLSGTSRTVTMAQFHQKPADTTGNWYPAFMFGKLHGGAFSVRTFPTDPRMVHRTYELIQHAAFAGRWHDVVVQAKWTVNADGFLRVWINDELKVDYAGATRSPGKDYVYFKYGLYRSSTPDDPLGAVMYYDELRRGRSRAEVDIRIIEKKQ